ncbi:hypothetical protein [Arthrobacter alkaliphilus]|uniref:hypothetical protein n=1 Tax=Arthrobacter alkaliphilus TaxID=369936 RepID=UPI001F258EF6|nr:hypothetical protein [Arthrobacter alkaliphilus]
MGPLRGGGPSARCSGRSAVPKKELPSGSDVDPAPGGDTDAGTRASGRGPAWAGDATVVTTTAGGMKAAPIGMNSVFVLICPGSSGAGTRGPPGSAVRDTTGTTGTGGTTGTDGGTGTAGAEGSGTAGTDGGTGTAGAEGSGTAGTDGAAGTDGSAGTGKAGSFPIVSVTVPGTASTTPTTGVKTFSVIWPTTVPGTAAN